MAIVFYRLYDKLNRLGLRRKALHEIISPVTAAKLARNEHINTATLNKLCEHFQCQPEELIEWIPDDENEEVIKQEKTR